MTSAKRLECLYCEREAVFSPYYERYVCDDCYKKGLGRDKKNERDNEEI